MKDSVSHAFYGWVFLLGLFVLSIIITFFFPEGLRGLLFEAVTTTIKISLSSTLCGFGLAVILIFFSAKTPIGRLINIIIHICRCTPMVCALLIFYWIPPVLGLTITNTSCAIIAISIIEGGCLAYILRNIKTDILSKFGESCFTLGLSRYQTFKKIIMPLTITVSIPHLYNFILFNTSSAALSSFIGVVDLTQAARIISTTLVDPSMSYTILFLFYICINSFAFYLARGFEASTGWSNIIQECGVNYE